MTAIQSLEDLERFKTRSDRKKEPALSGRDDPGCRQHGQLRDRGWRKQHFQAALKQMDSLQLENVIVSKIGCIGHCSEEPILQVITSDGQKTTYGHASAVAVEKIFSEHVMAGKIVHELQISI